MPRQLLIFTDLDGTLLDHDSYSWQPAQNALARLSALHIPLIFNTSKTAREVAALRHELKNPHPYIVENGGAVITTTEGGEEVYCFGRTYPEIRATLSDLRRKNGYQFSGFADLGIEGVMAATGLTRRDAEAACDRQSSEPLLWHGEESQLTDFKLELAKENLQLVQGGRFFHVMGHTDKGFAMNWLAEQFRRSRPQTNYILVALGDGENDLPMLQLADISVVIRPKSGPALSIPGHPRVIYPVFPGPSGWQEALDEILHLYL